MKPTLNLGIPTPCTENWDHMSPATQGRFCGSCEKTVVDFTAMDDHELVRWFANRQGSVCGRLRKDQLDRPLIAQTESPKRRYWQYLIATLLITSEAAAQTRPAKAHTSQQLPVDTVDGHLIGDTTMVPVKSKKTDSVRGRVVDSAGRPISYATVVYGPKAGVAADEQGYFAIPKEKVSMNQQLSISAVGYLPVNISVEKVQNEHQIKMFYTVTTEEAIAGGVVVVTKKRRKKVAADTLSLCKDTLAAIGLTIPALTAYPNPVARGAAITIKTRLDHTGKYSLQLYNSTGTLIESREIDRSLNTNNLALPIPVGAIPGIYFVKLSHPAMTRSYSQQIMVY